MLESLQKRAQTVTQTQTSLLLDTLLSRTQLVTQTRKTMRQTVKGNSYKAN